MSDFCTGESLDFRRLSFGSYKPTEEDDGVFLNRRSFVDFTLRTLQRLFFPWHSTKQAETRVSEFRMSDWFCESIYQKPYRFFLETPFYEPTSAVENCCFRQGSAPF